MLSRIYILLGVSLVWLSSTLPADGRRLGQCLEERRQTLFSASGSRVRSPGVYVPECLEDGSFSPVQCHQAAGYCWCVTPDGRPIPETSVEGTDVRCQDKGVRGKTSCSPMDRVEFNKNLVRIFSQEYARDPSVNHERRDGTNYDYNVINWKFLQLDEDRDGLLRRGDVRTLKKMLKKVVKPRKCAKTFDNHCDLDQDRRLSREEWSLCLGGDIRSLAKPPPGHSGKTCSPADREAFNLQLIDSFLKEFKTSEPEASATQLPVRPDDPNLYADTLLNTAERHAITWKFKQLDRDGDERLRRDEIRPLKAQVKASMKPKSCAKTLDSHCDLNNDQFIMANEWSVCLGVDINNAPTGGGATHGTASQNKGNGKHGSSAASRKALLDIFTSGTSSISPSSIGKDDDLYQVVSDQQNRYTDKPEVEESILDSGCIKARAHFLIEHRSDPAAHIFVPECLDTGQYRKEQCHNSTGFCWCVDQVTGRPIPMTSTHNVIPNCTNVKIREFKGCTYPSRNKFLTKLLDQLTTEMMQFANNASAKSPMLDTNPDWTLEERSVRWKLRMLDKNNNQRLERQELKQFKSAVRMKKDLRKCSRNFLRYCDENDDASITLEEWIDCTGINDQHRNLPDHSHSKGINPFTEYLKGAQ